VGEWLGLWADQNLYRHVLYNHRFEKEATFSSFRVNFLGITDFAIFSNCFSDIEIMSSNHFVSENQILAGNDHFACDTLPSYVDPRLLTAAPDVKLFHFGGPAGESEDEFLTSDWSTYPANQFHSGKSYSGKSYSGLVRIASSDSAMTLNDAYVDASESEDEKPKKRRKKTAQKDTESELDYRRRQNREAAKRSREKKNVYIRELETENESLKQRIDCLLNEIARLKS
jgi:hypothetical protein